MGIDLSDNYNKNINPMLEGVSIGSMFEGLHYVVSKNWVEHWDELTDHQSRNVFHLAAEFNKVEIIHMIVIKMLNQNDHS